MLAGTTLIDSDPWDQTMLHNNSQLPNYGHLPTNLVFTSWYADEAKLLDRLNAHVRELTGLVKGT
jgi:hypothetical protein